VPSIVAMSKGLWTRNERNFAQRDDFRLSDEYMTTKAAGEEAFLL
jgi:hypothetical protein